MTKFQCGIQSLSLPLINRAFFSLPFYNVLCLQAETPFGSTVNIGEPKA